MNDSYLEVLKQYEGEVTNVRRGRGAWICEYPDGLRLLKEYRGTIKRLEFEDAVALFREVIEASREADLLLFETFTDLYELKAALLAAREVSALPIVAMTTFDESGRMLTGADVLSAVTVAESLSAREATELAARLGVAIQFDTDAMAPYFYYTDADGVSHVVWFQDARSVEALASLAAEFSLAGIGVWNIMRPFPALWTVLSGLYSIVKL